MRAELISIVKVRMNGSAVLLGVEEAKLLYIELGDALKKYERLRQREQQNSHSPLTEVIKLNSSRTDTER